METSKIRNSWVYIMKTFKEIRARDYKDEYKKFQSSPERIKYRAELVKFNREKGTYGNRDKKDASHKGGKIVGFEAQSKNRGRAEASRLKKEYTAKPAKVSTGMKFTKLKGNPKRRQGNRALIRTVSAIVGVRG